MSVTRIPTHTISELQPKAVALAVVDTTRCTGCGRCVAACPPHVLWLDNTHPKGWGKKTAVLHSPEQCTGCAKCHLVCPFDAIRMQRMAQPT
ncbi:ATP-binding protein [Agitococcus lubricus]|uniref:4Fe-4S dicluster protein n=1 Tax=Agitococcus lubricus TaxID=1077255 RepID=A0A2T5IYB9_9GAMM|nr:ferredoxin family protein [Agitococcus lubricus]PTQ88952.1 4Fe-4S dicluster protein [Agitococcus lubricus]